MLLPADEVPDHSTLGHWVQAEAHRAGAVLAALDPACADRGRYPRPRRDLFWGRPTLVGIEPASMTAVFCRNTADRKAATWDEQLVPFTHLEFAVSDAAKGIAAAVAQRAAARRDDPSAPPLEHGLDVFHTAMEAHRVLARHWRRAEAAWEKAEQADAEVAGAKRQGIDARGPARAAGAAWRRATAAFDEAERLESAWGRAACALELFDADGRLNDRTRAAAEIAAALKDLTGPEWSKVRNFLTDRRSLAFLDRMHRRLESGRAAAGMAGGDGLAMVAAARPGRRVGPAHGVAPRGGAGSRVGRGGARQLRAGGGGAGGHGAGQ